MGGQDASRRKLVNEDHLVGHCKRTSCQLIEPRGRSLSRKSDSSDDGSALQIEMEFASQSLIDIRGLRTCI